MLNEFPNLDTSIRIPLEYNLSNGYSTRADLLTGQEAKDALHKAKALVQNLLIDKNQVGPNLLPSIMANYGNNTFAKMGVSQM